MSASTVGRVWADGRLKPHRVETFKYSRDPELVAKVTDVVGLYLAPPERAIVLSVDEKTQIQALDRTQPMLPLQARPGGAPHPRLQAQRHPQPVRGARGRDRDGDPRDPRAAHRRRLPGLPAAARPDLPRGEIEVVLDNVSTHKTPDVQAWLASTRGSPSTSRPPARPG